MSYQRLHAPVFSYEGREFTTTPSIHDFAKARARTRRARAERCWQLAGTTCDKTIVAELESYARELEEQAEMLEHVSSSAAGLLKDRKCCARGT